VHVIPQKSYVCDSYITDKKSLYAGPPVGGMHPPPSSPLDPPLNRTSYAHKQCKQTGLFGNLFRSPRCLEHACAHSGPSQWGKTRM